MNKQIFFLLFLIFSFTSVSANLVCGIVSSPENLSAVWFKAHVYYSSNISDIANCTINPENKFCCDLSDIKSVSFSAGKTVNAYIFEPSQGYISQTVSLVTTAEGYTLFPELVFEKAIKITNSSSNILLNGSVYNISGYFAEGYKNFNYSINGIEYSVCTNCENFSLEVPLEFGKNEILLKAYGDKVISKNLTVYRLEYLEISRSITCANCKSNLKVPMNSDISISIKINSSHNISGLAYEYYPSLFNLTQNIDFREYSETHNEIAFPLTGEITEFSYSLHTPSYFFSRNFIFELNVLGFIKQDTLHLSKSFNLIYLSETFNRKKISPTLSYAISPTKPLVIYPSNSSLQVIGVFPNIEKEIDYSFKEKKHSNNLYSYDIKTNLKDKEIERIFLRLRSEINKNLSVHAEKSSSFNITIVNDTKIYEGYINSKKFNISIT